MKKYILLLIVVLLLFLFYNWYSTSSSKEVHNIEQSDTLTLHDGTGVWTYADLGLSELKALGGNYMYTGSGNLNDTIGYVYGSFASGNYIQLLDVSSDKPIKKIALPALPIEIQTFGTGWFMRNLDSLYYLSDVGNVLVRKSCPKGKYNIERTAIKSDTSEVFILANGYSLLPEHTKQKGWLQSDGAYVWVDKMKDKNQNTVYISRQKDGENQSLTIDFGMPTGVLYNWGTVDGWCVFTVEKIMKTSSLKVETDLFVIPVESFSSNAVQMATIPAKQFYITRQNISLGNGRIYIRIPQSKSIQSYTLNINKLTDSTYLHQAMPGGNCSL